MATGTIRQESWIEVSPIQTIYGDNNNGSNLHFYRRDKTLRVYGYVTPASSATVVTINLKSEYKLIQEDFIFMRFSGWNYTLQEYQSGSVSSDGGSISYGAGNFAYCKADHEFMLQ